MTIEQRITCDICGEGINPAECDGRPECSGDHVTALTLDSGSLPSMNVTGKRSPLVIGANTQRSLRVGLDIRASVWVKQGRKEQEGAVHAHWDCLYHEIGQFIAAAYPKPDRG